MGLPDVTALCLVSNIDHNVGRMLAKLDEHHPRHDRDLHDRQRPPAGAPTRACAGSRLRFRGHPGALLHPLAAVLQARHVPGARGYIDVLPTLLKACGLAVPKGVNSTAAGSSTNSGRLPGHSNPFQGSSNGIEATSEKFRACAVRENDWKAI
jgi:hypothetical protein